LRTAVGLLLAVPIITSCQEKPADTTAQTAVAQNGELTAEQLEKGVGPITRVELTAEIDERLASTGGEVFTAKCSACHKLNEKYIGPALFDVTQRRRPEYIMNMMLNPAEMVQKHPVAKALLAEYNFTPMANQNLTEADARAVLEYLRAAAEKAEDENDDDDPERRQ
jgi:mono/diheme cytochrome c family protein